MPDSATDLSSAVADLDDGYLKVLLLLAVRRARSDEPRRAGFWHALAVTLAEEQETRLNAAKLGGEVGVVGSDEGTEVERVLDELVGDLTTLKSEVRESAGQVDAAGTMLGP